MQDREKLRLRKHDLQTEADGDGRYEHDDKRLDQTKSPALEQQEDEHVEGGHHNTGDQRKVKEKVKSYGRPDHFGKIARGNTDFRKDPKHYGCSPPVMLSACLGQISP